MFETFFQCRHMLTGDFDDYFYRTVENLYHEVIDLGIEDEDQEKLNSPIQRYLINQ